MTMRKKYPPYHPPQITKILLRREQAILSQCTLNATDPRFAESASCVKNQFVDCKGVGPEPSPDGDSGGRPS